MNWIINFYGACGNDGIAGVKELANNSIRIFPNPTSNILNIESDFNLKDIQIEITNTLGQTLKSIYRLNADRININIPDLPNGVYFLQLQSGEQRITKTVIKEN